MGEEPRLLARDGFAARSLAPSVADVVAADGDVPPAGLMDPAIRDLGTEDIAFSRYTSRAFYDREMERMWPRTWQWVCREEHIPEPGDHLVYDIGRHSILVVRTSDGGIKAYPNACLHRGTKLRPSGTIGSSPDLRCPFHGWTWTLEGALAKVPCRWDLPQVDEAAFGLPEFRTGTWGGFVFVNMDGAAPPLEDYLEVLPAHAARSGLERRHIAVHVEKELACNWKVASEAFLEAYHVQETHPQIMVANGDEAGQYDVFGPHVNRIIVCNGVTSPHLARPVTEQERADAMLAGDVTSGRPIVHEGETARSVMARHYRELLGIADAEAASATELLDTHGYLLFPNGHFFLGQAFPIAYRIRPLDDRVDAALFEMVVLRATPPGEEPPPPAEPVRLKVGDSYATVPGISPSFALIMDQDTSIMGWQQEGFSASVKPGATLTRYQEVRIRHAHETLDAYLATPPGEPVRFAKDPRP